MISLPYVWQNFWINTSAAQRDCRPPWYNFFAATGEYFYHANVRTPRWLRFIIQTPELHSIHHQYDVHSYNFGDIPLWDRLFGTYRDTTMFAGRCGFPHGPEEKLIAMLAFKDVYSEAPAAAAARPALPDPQRIEIGQPEALSGLGL